MKTAARRTFVALVASTLVLPLVLSSPLIAQPEGAGSSDQKAPPHRQLLDLSLADAPLRVVLTSFARIMELELDTSAAPADALAKDLTVSWSQVPAEDALRQVLEPRGLEAERTDTLLVIRPLSNLRFTGEPVSMSLRDAELGEVAASMARLSGLEFDSSRVPPEFLESPVTAELDRVPWDQALHQLLKVRNLSYERQGDTVVLYPSGNGGSTGLQLTPDPETDLIDLDLLNAPVEEVLRGFADLAEAAFAFDLPEPRTITIRLNQVHWSTAFTAVCESVGCNWALVADSRGHRLLRIAPAAHEGDGYLDVDLAGAAAETVLGSIVSARGLGRVGGAALEGEVSWHLEGVHWSTLLDALCDARACTWTVTNDEPRSLELTTRQETREARPLGELDTPVDLSLAEAPVLSVLTAFASVLGARLDGNAPAGTWSGELESVPVQTALDEVCEQTSCQWELQLGDAGRVLLVHTD